MTESRDFKRLVRKRMAESGESYTLARASFDDPPKRAAAGDAQPPTPMSVAQFKRRVLSRRGLKNLSSHLEETYGVRVIDMTQLELGVYRVDRSGGSSWVARVFPAARSVDAVRGDAEILLYLQGENFPAEQPIEGEPISILAGQPVLITEWAPGTNRRDDTSEATMHSLGSMTGRLAALRGGPDACRRPAGSWHHLSANGGTRTRDVDVLLTLLDDAGERIAVKERSLMATLRADLQALDDFADLPTALVHPDPCGANLVARDGDEGVLVDWAGAGTGPRLAAFASLVGPVQSLALVDAAVAGYRAHTSLELAELDNMEAALIQFPLILDCWSFLFQGAPLGELARRLSLHKQRAAAVADRARAAFAAPDVSRFSIEQQVDQERLF